MTTPSDRQTVPPTTPPTAPTQSLPERAHPPGTNDASTPTGLRQLGTTIEHALEARDYNWYLIGTSRGADIKLQDPFASASAVAILWVKGEGFVLADRGSKNGTYVNGQKIIRCPLEVGQRVRIGQTEFVIYSDETKAQLEPEELLVGDSTIFAHVRERALSAARARVNIVLIGESGTGKQLLARAIHAASPAFASGRALVVLDATAVDEAGLCEALDAAPAIDSPGDSPGSILVHRADRLSEVGMASVIGLANRLEEAPIDAPRLIVTTAEAAPSWTASLGVPLVLTIPPLRERALDVPQLVAVIARELSYGAKLDMPPIETAALAGLPWENNVSELRRAVRRMIAEGNGRLATETIWQSEEQMHDALREALRRAIESAPSRRAAADALGIPWSSFRDWVRKLRPKG